MDGGIRRIERTGPEPAARVHRVERREREPFAVDEDDDARRDDDEDERRDGDADEAAAPHGHARDRDDRPIAPRGDDESGAHLDLTA